MWDDLKRDCSILSAFSDRRFEAVLPVERYVTISPKAGVSLPARFAILGLQECRNFLVKLMEAGYLERAADKSCVEQLEECLSSARTLLDIEMAVPGCPEPKRAMALGNGLWTAP